MQKTYLLGACFLMLSLVACEKPEPITKDLGPDFDLLTTPVGDVNFPTGCNAQAAPLVERGVALVHHMMYEEADFVFSMADDADPDCAMAYWGQAMTIIHPLWPDKSSPAAIERGLKLVEKTLELGGHSDRENSYIETTRAYFKGDLSQSEPTRLKHFATAWKNVSDAYPDDLEARAFHSLTLLSTADRGDVNLVKQRQAGKLAVSILNKNPKHPGGHHYIIHSYDDPDLAELALSTADNYGKLTPRVPHATHMMTHTYTRLGQWDKSIEWNMISSETALAICIERGEINNHYTHALDYLAYAQLQKGNDEAALQILKDINELKGPYSELNRSSFAYAFSALPARVALEQHDWHTAAQLPIKMPQDFPWQKEYDPYIAITHFARAVALSQLDRFDEAANEIDILLSLRLNIAQTSPYWAKQVEIQELSARAWQSYSQGEISEGLTLMQSAASLEATTEKHAVTPGEVWPAAEMYGDMLLKNGHNAEALNAYRVALIRAPGRYNSLYGAAKAAINLNDKAAAKAYFSELSNNAVNAPTPRPSTIEARNYLASL